jgi:hypothetical protein
MDNIPLNKIGLIESGDYSGWQVKIELCSPDSESCLVLLSRNFEDGSAEGYDDWVKDFHCLRQYFKESKWVISWG